MHGGFSTLPSPHLLHSTLINLGQAEGAAPAIASNEPLFILLLLVKNNMTMVMVLSSSARSPLSMSGLVSLLGFRILWLWLESPLSMTGLDAGVSIF